MERSDLEIIDRLTPAHPELRHLWARHQQFERDLERLGSIRNPSDTERREMSRIKRVKLQEKERIAKILMEHR